MSVGGVTVSSPRKDGKSVFTNWMLTDTEVDVVPSEYLKGCLPGVSAAINFLTSFQIQIQIPTHLHYPVDNSRVSDHWMSAFYNPPPHEGWITA